MPTHQYQVTDGDGVVRLCDDDTSTVSLPMNSDGRVEPDDATGQPFIADEVIVYYIDNARDFTLTITGTNPSIEEDTLTVISGDAPSYTHTINAAGELVMTIRGPASNGSHAVWQFSATAPPLHVKVRVKRQTGTISCA